jgi:hypothetical protein
MAPVLEDKSIGLDQQTFRIQFASNQSKFVPRKLDSPLKWA